MQNEKLLYLKIIVLICINNRCYQSYSMGIVNQNASLHLPLLRRLHLCGATCSVLEVRFRSRATVQHRRCAMLGEQYPSEKTDFIGEMDN